MLLIVIIINRNSIRKQRGWVTTAKLLCCTAEAREQKVTLHGKKEQSGMEDTHGKKEQSGMEDTQKRISLR